MAKAMHTMDLLAIDVAEWIESVSTDVVNALTEGGIAPFAANVDSKEKLAYFGAQVYMPDGSINVEGRNQLMTTYGPDGYAAIMRSVLKSMGGMPPIPAGAFAPAGSSALPATPPQFALSAMPIPGMATGGPVDPDQPYWMGEQGPEEVVPDQTAATPYMVGMQGPQVVVPPQPSTVIPNYQLSTASDPSQSDAGHGNYNRDVTVPTGDQWWRESNQPASVSTQPADVNPAPSTDEIRQYIVQAAAARDIDPNVALTVAQHEGFRTGEAAQRGTFSTGSSWWPFQLHYGGAGYQQYGTVAGLGNDFTAATGYQPGDPKAWKASVDFALDAAKTRGWYPTFYGSVPAGVSKWQGIKK